MTTSGTPTKARHPWGNRGRHRRPRPRKAVLAAGGLALAAGALSLVRLLPEPGGDVDAFGAEAGPRVETGGGRGTAPDPATTPAAVSTAGPPEVSPSATSAMGGLSGSPQPGLIPGPGPFASGPSAARPSATTVPDSPNTDDSAPPPAHTRQPPQPPGSPQQPRPDTPTPRPTPTPPPDRGTPPTPAPTPDPEPDPPGLCVPVIGLCVDLLDGDD